jgi:hypothetical protein
VRRGSWTSSPIATDVDEPRDAAVRGEDAERSEPGVNEVHGGLHNALERGVQLHAVGDGEDRVKQSLHAATGRDDLGEALLHLTQQLVEPKARLHVRYRSRRRLVNVFRQADPLCCSGFATVRTNTSTVSRPRCAHNSGQVFIDGEMPVARRKGPFARSPHHGGGTESDVSHRRAEGCR